jgi:hypothetical protein
MNILKNKKEPQLKTSSIAVLAGRINASIHIAQMDKKKRPDTNVAAVKGCTATNQSPLPSQFSWC